ncbi:MAG TPA: hypothetical protein VGP72_32205 [Planctomycetota bacterium]|jgi:hypothetical protein
MHMLLPLLGLLLIIAGIVVALVSGLDLLYGPLGLAISAAGLWLVRRSYEEPPPEVPQGDRQRSVQKPEESDAHTRINRRL